MRARQRDANEKAVVDALLAAGCSVTRIDAAGVPDLLVGIGGRTMLLEVKNPEAKGGGKYNTGDGCLTATQTKWLASWKGEKPVIVTSAFEALCTVGHHAYIAGDPGCVHCGV